MAALALALVWPVVAPPALAQDGPRVVVRSFDGPRAARVRASVVKALQGGELSLVASDEVDSTAERLGVSASGVDGRVAISGELGIDAWVDGRVAREGRNWTATVQVVDGGTGENLETALWDARSWRALSRVVGREAAEVLVPPIQRGQRPEAAPEPEPDEDEPVEASDEPERGEEESAEEPADDDPADAGDPDELPVPLELGLGISLFSRDYAYTENLGGLPTYDVSMPPVVGLEARWYPAAHATDGWPAHLGLSGRFGVAFGLDSESDSGATFATSSSHWEVGIRGRLPADAFELGLGASYGGHEFTIDDASQDGATIDPGVPAAEYGYLRFQLEARMRLGDAIQLGLHGSWLPLLSTGEVEDWFPRASGTALDGGAEVGVSVDDGLSVLAQVSARRYAITLDPRPDDVDAGRPIAGGAVDDYLTVGVGVRWAVGGSP